jgi:isoleucyl-tRNA synthetase
MKNMTYNLNLFKSNFELTQTHANKSEYLALWSSADTVRKLHREPAARPLFLLHDGPPYANGALHLGHFVNKSLKDALLKFKRLDGYFAPFVPGFDCHGLPVELEVEKLGHTKDNPRAFVEACRVYAEGQVASQTAEFRSFGVAADWDSAYRTMDPEFEAGAAELFSTLPGVVKRLRPVHWCPECSSSLAEAEVEYKTRMSDSLVVLFALEGRENTFLQVWTTTPYTLPANKAVAFNPAMQYVLLAEGGRQLVRARRAEDPVELELVDLEGCTAKSPYTGDTVPLLPADYVSSTGTGLVHLAPSFGMDDFRVGERFSLPVETYVDEQGRFVCGDMKGMDLKQAAAHVKTRVEALTYSCTRVEHEYPHCWRHKRPVFFRASEEWFLELDALADAAQAALSDVQFVPASGRERLGSMLQGRTSWCLSRNRLWGTPLVDARNAADVEALDAVRLKGVGAWQDGAPRRTLDVWFDSGVTHELVLMKRFGRTADVYLEGSDQHRGWFQSSLLTGMALRGRAPFRKVLTHGFVVDEHGRKFSKSSGNYLPLSEMFARHSPDVLRLWALQQDFTKELKLSPQSMALAQERYRKLRNTVRFCLQNTVDFDGQPRDVTEPLNRYEVVRLHRLVREVRSMADESNLSGVVAALVQYAETVSGTFFTVAKDWLYCETSDSRARREAQYLLTLVLDTLTRLLVPVMPFTAEEAYQASRVSTGATEPSVVLLTLAGLHLPELGDEEAQRLEAVFDALAELKGEANRYAEQHRTAGVKSVSQLELEVTVPMDVAWLDADKAQTYFGSAPVNVSPGEDFALRMRVTQMPACPRCRRRVALAGVLCGRCERAEPELARACRASGVHPEG